MLANMSTIAVVNATGLSGYALRPLRAGRSALDLALEAARGLPGVGRVVLLARDRSLVIRVSLDFSTARTDWEVGFAPHGLASRASGVDFT